MKRHFRAFVIKETILPTKITGAGFFELLGARPEEHVVFIYRRGEPVLFILPDSNPIRFNADGAECKEKYRVMVLGTELFFEQFEFDYSKPN